MTANRFSFFSFFTFARNVGGLIVITSVPKDIKQILLSVRFPVFHVTYSFIMTDPTYFNKSDHVLVEFQH